MCVMMMLLGIAYVALPDRRRVRRQHAALIPIGAVLGFFVWNFPAGLIFLGDGGAYFIGFVLAELSVLLLAATRGVSPMFPLLLCAYPIFETIFTMYRRSVLRGVATAQPDGIHLHTLIHRRLMRWSVGADSERRRMTPQLDDLALPLAALPAVDDPERALVGQHARAVAASLFSSSSRMCFLYWSIVRFRTPRWLVRAALSHGLESRPFTEHHEHDS